MADTVTNIAATAATPALINLIENAAASFEVDRNAARDYLFRAFALIRAQKRVIHESPVGPVGLIGWQTKRAMAYIDAHLSAAIQVKDLAEEVHLSVSHFFRSFRISVGMTPCEYVTRRRIEVAQILMSTTRESFCQIAIECGWNDQSHLCRIFRRYVGQTPNTWRKIHAREPTPAESTGRGQNRQSRAVDATVR